MSVADVCELESILKCEADEKVALEKKIYELEKQCKIVEKNVSRYHSELYILSVFVLLFLPL